MVLVYTAAPFLNEISFSIYHREREGGERERERVREIDRGGESLVTEL